MVPKGMIEQMFAPVRLGLLETAPKVGARVGMEASNANLPNIFNEDWRWAQSPDNFSLAEVKH